MKSAGLSSPSALVCCSGLATVNANGLELSKVCNASLRPRQLYQAFMCENVAPVGRVKVDSA